MSPVDALGNWVYPFAALTLAVVWITVAVIRLRRGPWTPLENKLTLSLFVFAAAFPVIGWAGTALGLIQSFHAVDSVDPSNKATLLSNGISQAMRAGLFGLLLAIPTSLIAVALLLTGAKRAPKKQPPRASG